MNSKTSILCPAKVKNKQESLENSVIVNNRLRHRNVHHDCYEQKARLEQVFLLLLLNKLPITLPWAYTYLWRLRNTLISRWKPRIVFDLMALECHSERTFRFFQSPSLALYFTAQYFINIKL